MQELPLLERPRAAEDETCGAAAGNSVCIIEV